MKIKNKVIIALLAAGIIVIIAGVIFHAVPLPSKCNPGGCITNPHAPGCGGSVSEIAPDPSLPAPTAQPYLGGFTAVQGGGPPFCGGVWYAYRYVTTAGGYSPLSPWSGSNPANPSLPPLPIYGGSANLPCPAGGCAAWGITPTGTCQANNPTIILTDALPSLPPGITLNVHRQSGVTFDPTSEGIIIGAMLAKANSWNGACSGVCPAPVMAFFIDGNPTNNPAPNSIQTNCC
jgi:hypothetical protein